MTAHNAYQRRFTFCALLLLVSWGVAVLVSNAQVAGNAVGSLLDYTAIERGPHHTIWARVVWEPTPFGTSVAHTNTYCELASGLNYLQNGVWVPAQEIVQGFPGGAVALHGQNQVIFANDLATPDAVDMEAPDGTRFRSHILGLSYRDLNSGSNVLIAEIQDCQGNIIGSNQVLYPDAFTDVKASVRYTYAKSGLEQDILLEQAPPPPEAYGLDSATTVLEVITEFLDPLSPIVTPTTVPTPDGSTIPDCDLDFGLVKIGRGKAFSIGGQEEQPIPVSKQWIEIDQRQLLIEDAPFPLLRNALQALPPAGGASVEPRSNSIRHVVSNTRRLPPHHFAKSSEKPMKMASLTLPKRALTLDYFTLNGSYTNYTFQENSTYFISGTVNLVGVTTFDGGCVIKVPISNSAGILTTNAVWQTRPYSPVILTASDDNNYGEAVSGSTGNPSGYYGKVAIDFTGAASLPVLSNLRCFYLSNAIAGPSLTLQDAQIVKCKTGVGSGSTSPTLYNVLAYLDNTVFGNTGAGTLTGINVTAHYCTNLLGNTTGTVNLTNCLFAAVTNWQCTSTYTNNDMFVASDTGVFQTVGAGGHYLADNSPYRNAGTGNVPTNLLASLRAKTTYPPFVYSNSTFSADATFSPQAQRDTDAVDLGYHYDPIDYAFGGVTANANLTFTAGTVAGWFRTASGWNHAGQGIHLGDTETATFNGLAESPAYWVRCCGVQEEASSIWQGGYGPGGITGWTWPTFSQAPTLNMRFTRCSTGGDFTNPFRDDNGYLVVNASHCEFNVAGLGGYVNSLNFTNCLFERTSVWTSWTDSGGASTNCAFRQRNCLMHGGNIGLARSSVNTPATYPPWQIQDSAFDGTTTNTFSDGANGASSVTYFDYNAFLTGSTRLTPNGAHDVLVSGSFGWQSSWLGNYYYPSNSALVNAGSLTNAALLGLYHFTTQTNQTKEATTPLDISYHYVATDSNGNPIDTDGNGIPDYIEDANGNGTVDSGEMAWNAFGDLGLKVLITRPKNNSTIP